MLAMKNPIKMNSPVRAFSYLLGAALLAVTSFAQSAVLKDMSYAALPGDKFEVTLTFDGPPPEVKGYSIERPARIALDLIGATSELTNKYYNLGTGNARNITVVEAKDRTRLIVNLVQLQGYKTDVNGNTLVLELGGQAKDADQQIDTSRAGVAESQVDVIDFRRGAQGEGQVVANLSKASIPVDVREESGRIIARFVGAKLPKELHRRLDVTDFATPVRFIDAKYDGKDTIVSIEATGPNWEYLAYQADNKFTINVKEISQAEAGKRKKDAFQYTGEKLSLSFQDIEVRSVLQLIADFTGLNLVASDTVTGRITLRLQNVPWDQALDLILKTKGLDKRQIGNVLLVAPADEIAAREQLELESQKKVEALAPLRTEYVRINYAKATDMEKLIKDEGSLLSARGTITTDERTNTLIIQDTDNKLEEIKEVVGVLDVEVQQVLIESRVVIASNNVAKAIGVRWGGIQFDGNSLADNGTSFLATGRGTQMTELGTGLSSGDDIDIETPGQYVVDMGVDDLNATRLSLGFLDLDSGLLQLELSALDSEGMAELVATPKVLTADQQPALIASGQQIGYETATASGATQLEFIEAELRLEVTPQITPEGKVLMQIKVNNDSVNGDPTGQQRPLIDTNRLETSVLVGDGETVVLGGIFQQQVINSVVKTPLLGDLPWIGNLFRRKENSNIKQELLIFITPKVVKDLYATK